MVRGAQVGRSSKVTGAASAQALCDAGAQPCGRPDARARGPRVPPRGGRLTAPRTLYAPVAEVGKEQ